MPDNSLPSTPWEGFLDVATTVYGGSRPLFSVIQSIINITLGLLGIIFFVLIIISGIQWMTSGGDEEKINKAKHRLTAAVIGLAIILASLIIARFVISKLGQVTGA
jgi:TRAP-type C4-dicarboxylate transport system permease small subunit